jgi:hypothetical protein
MNNKLFYSVIIALLSTPYRAIASYNCSVDVEELIVAKTLKCFPNATKISFCLAEDHLGVNIQEIRPFLSEATHIYDLLNYHWNTATPTDGMGFVTMDTDSPAEITLLDSSFNLPTPLTLLSDTRITCKNTIATLGRNALLVAPTIHTSNFFLTTSGTVEFQGTDPKGPLLSVKFAFSPKLKRPFTCMFEGTLDFNNFAYPSTLLVIGAESVTFTIKANT